MPPGSSVFKRHVSFEKARGPWGEQKPKNRKNVAFQGAQLNPIAGNFREAVLALLRFHRFREMVVKNGIQIRTRQLSASLACRHLA